MWGSLMCSGALLALLWSNSSYLSPPLAALFVLSAAPVVPRLGRWARPARPAGASNATRRPVCAAGRRPCRRPQSAHARSASPPRSALLALRSVLGHGRTLCRVGAYIARGCGCLPYCGLGEEGNASRLSSSPPTILSKAAQIIPQKCSPRTPRPLLLLRGPLEPSTQQLSPCKSCLFPRKVAFKKCVLWLLCSSVRRPQCSRSCPRAPRAFWCWWLCV